MPQTLNYEPKPPALRSRAVEIVVLVGLLLLGVQLWLLTDFWLYRPLGRIVIYAAAVVACFLPPVQRAVSWLGAALAERSALHTLATVMAVTLASVAALYATAVSAGRQFTLVFHDEFAYLLQARMIASGRLWMPAHPLGDFFDTFYVITGRAYATQYFPGTAMLLAPGVWLNLPPWVIPLALSGIACGLLFLILRDLFDATAAIAGVVVMVGVPVFRLVSIMATAQVPALVLLLATCWMMIRWDRHRHGGWLVLAGGVVGWLAITRPLDAAVVGVACAVFACWRLRRSPLCEWRRVMVTGLLPLVPFACIQLALNRGVTGSITQTPFGYYAERDMPGTALGFHTFDERRRPISTLPQKQAFFDLQVVPAARSHTVRAVGERWLRERLKFVVTDTLPDMLLIILLPIGLLGLRGDARRWMVVAIAPLWWAAYSLHVFTFFHYYVVLIPSTMVVLMSGFEQLGRLGRPILRASPAMRLVLPLTITVLAMPQFKIDVQDQAFTNPVEDALIRSIRAEVTEPRSIILVRYHVGAMSEQEVVYNVDVAWPDDAKAIRVHDLGDERNRELYRYYAQRQPDRVVYRFDRKDFTMHRLGTVTELANVDAGATRPTIVQDGHSSNAGDMNR